MEHVVQLGISIDDDAIQKQIMKTAEKTIVGEIKSDISKQIFYTGNPYYGSPKNELSERAEGIVKEWLDENSDKIIELAGKMVAEKVFRSKKWKDKYSEVTEE